MNSTPDNDDRLEVWLRDSAPPLSDLSFSARVMAALPPPKARRETTRRSVLCVIAAIVGIVVAWPAGESWREVSAHLANWEQVFTVVGAALVEPMTVTALVVAMLSLFAVFWRNDRLLG